MAYKKKKKSSSFLHKCTSKIARIKRARKSSSKVKAVTSYQKCLEKHNIRTGLKTKKK